VIVRALLVAAVVALASGPLTAQERSARLCAPADLTGTWEVVDMSAAFRMDRNDPYYYQHQRFAFETGGGVRHVTSTKPFTPTEWRALTAAPATSTWSLDDRGRLIVTRPSGQEGVVCTFGLQPVENQHAGDVVLTYFDRGQPVLKRVLRKVAAP
jgi:hypothetical protein